MERLARLLPLRQYGRLRHLRAPRDCAVIGAAARVRGFDSGHSERHVEHVANLVSPAWPIRPASSDWPRSITETTVPAGQTTRPAIVAHAAATVVRVYRSSSRVIMVGTIDAVCEMIDRCIAEENAGMTGGLFDRAA